MPYAPVPRLRLRQDQQAQELAVVANFAEVWLAKQGHHGPVGVNFLEKVQMATPAAAYGAMLAGVDVVLAGAGIPRELPRLLGALARHEPVSLPVDVIGASDDQRHEVGLDPVAVLGMALPPLRRPVFLAIVSAHVLAEYLARDPAIRPDGFVIEGPTGRRPQRAAARPAHPGRQRPAALRPARQRRPGPARRDRPAVLAGRRLRHPGTAARGPCRRRSRRAGRHPVRPQPRVRACVRDLRSRLLDQARDETLRVRTDPAASPTGFPFKVAQLPGTLADPQRYNARPRLCDLGHLRVPYLRPGGAVGYRCPAEPVHMYVRKGGDPADTADRSCLCNALLANVGLGQTRASGYAEDPLVTLGSDLDGVREMLQRHAHGWSAAQAVTWLLAR